jgi:hypothetical protein
LRRVTTDWKCELLIQCVPRHASVDALQILALHPSCRGHCAALPREAGGLKRLCKFRPPICCPIFLHGPFPHRIASLSLELWLDCAPAFPSAPILIHIRGRCSRFIASGHRVIHGRGNSIWDEIHDRKMTLHFSLLSQGGCTYGGFDLLFHSA